MKQSDQSIGTPLLLTSPLKVEESDILHTVETKPLIFILINHLGSSTIPKAPCHRLATPNLRDKESEKRLLYNRLLYNKL